MKSKTKLYRISGLLYLLVVATGMFSLAYVPKKLFVWDSPARTFKNITDNEMLFRWSIASSVVCYLAFIFLAIFLYQLLRPVNDFIAKTMALLAVISVPVSLINLQNKYAVLSLIALPAHQNVSLTQEKQNQVLQYLNHYDDGILIASIFWGLWLLPFGYLVYKSGFLPKLLGILLMMGCFGYLVNFFGYTLLSNYNTLGVGQYFGLLPAIGEIGICFWLLFLGVKNEKK